MSIPAELKALDQWVAWRSEERGGKKTKVPYRVDGTGMASVSDPSTWGTAQQAYELAETDGYGGIGFVVTANDEFCGIDLDRCVDPETGEVDPEARATVERFKSYTEVTPSKAGLRIWIRARLTGARNRTGHVEVYDKDRYFTMTGRPLSGTEGWGIEGRQAELDAFYAELWPPTPPKPAVARSKDRGPSMGAYEVIERAGKARNAAKFDRLMRGDIADYGSESEADLALAGVVAFYSQDPGVILAVIRNSGLWDQKWERDDYADRTVSKALEGLTETYSPEPSVRPVSGTAAPTAPDLTLDDLRITVTTTEPRKLTIHFGRGPTAKAVVFKEGVAERAKRWTSVETAYQLQHVENPPYEPGMREGEKGDNWPAEFRRLMESAERDDADAAFTNAGEVLAQLAHLCDRSSLDTPAAVIRNGVFWDAARDAFAISTNHAVKALRREGFAGMDNATLHGVLGGLGVRSAQLWVPDARRNVRVFWLARGLLGIAVPGLHDLDDDPVGDGS